MTFPDNAISLPPCSTEDSENCFWDAAAQGNAGGQSFFEYDGYTVLIQVRDGYHVEEVLVNPDGLDWSEQSPGYAVILRENAPAPAPTAPIETPEATTETAAPATTPSEPVLAGIDLTPAPLLVAVALAAGALTLGILLWKGRNA